jgi:tRNA dimethylallyltransferase
LNGKLLILLGATATGKTALALRLAQALDGEIIGADSRQIYRHMPIGTAQPTPEQRALIPHHLIGFVDPAHNLALAEYQDHALRAIADVTARGKLPMLVGGTGQYITAIAEGWSIPRVSPNLALRAELEAYAQTEGAQALYARLLALDPEYASKTHPNNVRRVVRALEVCLESGATMTELQRKVPPPYDIRTLGVFLPREQLYPRADARVDAMMRDGFLQEVQALLTMGYDRHLPSMSGLGYAELCAHLLDGLPLATAVERTKFNTHDFIRRQEVWFRGHDNGILWHNSESLRQDSPQEALLMRSLAQWRKE